MTVGLPGPRPAVTAVVATHDRPSLLGSAVASVLASLAAGDELLIVESGDSRAAQVVAALPGRVRLLTAAPVSKSAKLNRAALAASNEVLVLTDDDCVVEPAWASGLANAFSDPAVGAAFGPVSGLSRLPGAAEPVRLPPGPAPQELWAFAHGASMAVRRSALLHVGGFDERLGPGSRVPAGEEGDLVLRLRERGWLCVVADAPPVSNRDGRHGRDEAANVLAYHRGAGASLGAGLRRAPRRTAKQLLLRCRFEASVMLEQRFRGAGPLLGAFAGGLVAGSRMRPRRWV